MSQYQLLSHICALNCISLHFIFAFSVGILWEDQNAAEFYKKSVHKSCWLCLLTFISYLVFQSRPTMTSSLGTWKLYQEPTDFSCNGIVFQCLKEQEGRGGASQSYSYWVQSLFKIIFEYLRVKTLFWNSWEQD